jgi:N-acetyl-D-muramate 6-phosphate phosphatase
MKYQAILFDLDGTLVDTAPDFIYAANQLRAELGLPALAPAVIRDQVSNGAQAVTAVALGEVNHPDIDQHRKRLLEIYFAILPKTKAVLFEGISQLLEQAEKVGIRWGIVTNKPLFYTEPLLAALKLTPHCLVCPDHVTHKKPHAEPLIKACALLSIPCSQAIYIGDHQRDIESGKNAAMDTVGVTYGYIEPNEDPYQWGAHFVVGSARDLFPIVFSNDTALSNGTALLN